jgi:RND superfamily putative drug exporter
MSKRMNRRSATFRIASVPSGRRMKYVIVVAWLVVIAVGGALAGRLQGAEKNDASAWLPAKAESTQALNLQARFVSKNVFPAVVVYQRTSGLTQADRAKVAADAHGFATVAGVGGRLVLQG